MANGCENSLRFLKPKHVKYCLRCLEILPERFCSLDSTRLIVVFFAVSGLDLLDSLSSVENIRVKIIDWVYNLQILPGRKRSNSAKCGFRGSTSCVVTELDPKVEEDGDYDMAHIAMTYTALTTLLILGDDLSKVNKKGIMLGLKSLQLPDGSFRPLQSESENDMRFIYCAACICYILQDWSGMDVKKAIAYIQNSLTYDGGISQGPGLEAHAGSTFCAVASLWLMGKIKSTFTLKQIENLCRWCVFRQQGGFQGRPNKLSDTCYSFWVGATLKLLGKYQCVNFEELVQFVLSNQNSLTGGIGKWTHDFPDPLHTYLGIGGLSLLGLDGTSPVNAALNISQRAVNFLFKLHKKWEKET